MTDTTPENQPNQLKLNIPDVYIVAQGLDMAIKRKVFSEDEIKKIYVPWSNVIRFCEDIRRKTEVEELYKKETPDDIPDETPDVITPVITEITPP